MKKQVIKILIVTIIIICLCIATNPKAYAYSIENIFVDAQDFLKSGNDVNDTINTAALHMSSSFIYKLLLAIGVIVATVVGVVLGIQFMVSSAEDKAKVKEALVAYVVSCIVLFGAYNIWTLVVNIAQDTTGGDDISHCNHEKGFSSDGSKFHKCNVCHATFSHIYNFSSVEYHACTKCHYKIKHDYIYKDSEPLPGGGSTKYPVHKCNTCNAYHEIIGYAMTENGQLKCDTCGTLVDN